MLALLPLLLLLILILILILILTLLLLPPLLPPPLQALVINFIGALSSVFGLLIYQYATSSNYDIGITLTFGGATYLYISCIESTIPMFTTINSIQDVLYRISAFGIGCILIGLVMIGHEHCYPSEAE